MKTGFLNGGTFRNLTVKQRAAAIAVCALADSARCAYNKNTSMCNITTYGGDYAKRTLIVHPDGTVEVVDTEELSECFQAPGPGNETKTTMVSQEPEIEEEFPEIVELEAFHSTDLVPAEDEIDPIAMLFDHSSAVENRAEVLLQILAGVAARKINGRLLPAPGDTARQKAAKAQIAKAQVYRATLQELTALKAVANVAELRIAIEMAAIGTHFLQEDGTAIDLAEEIRANLPPGQRGRAKQISSFIMVDTPTLLDHDIQPGEISGIVHDGSVSKLGAISPAISRVVADPGLDKPAKTEELKKIVSDATTMTVRGLERKYGTHRFSPAPAQIQPDGAYTLLRVWLTPAQYRKQFLPRVGKILDFDTAMSVTDLTPDYVLTHSKEEIFRAAVNGYAPRRHILAVLGHAKAPASLAYVASVLTDYTEHAIRAVLADLTRWGLVERSGDNGEEHLWAIC